MKAITCWFTMIACVIMVFSVRAQTSSVDSADIPIVSEEMLDAYALSLVGSVGVQMYEDNSHLPGFYTNVVYTGRVADARALVQVPTTVRPRINVVNPTNNQVNYHVSYEGGIRYMELCPTGYVCVSVGQQYQLFYGQESQKPVYGRGGWNLSTFKINLNRSDWIPWRKKGLQSASMTIRDKDGNSVSYYNFDWDHRIDRNNGIIFLGSQHVNRRGELYLTFEDVNGKSTTEVVDLGSGKKIVPVDIVSEMPRIILPQVSVLADNTLEVAHDARRTGPKMAYVEYTRVTDIRVSVIAPIGLRVTISVADAEDLPIGEEAWHLIDPGTHHIEAGRRLYFRFDYGVPNSNPIPYPNYPTGEGKG
jgi:hypothetical protein